MFERRNSIIYENITDISTCFLTCLQNLGSHLCWVPLVVIISSPWQSITLNIPCNEKRWKAYRINIFHNIRITWLTNFILFGCLSIENFSAWWKLIFSVFNPQEIDAFNQNWIKTKIDDVNRQIISWELKWYMTDLVNVKYFVSYGEKRVLMLNIQDKLSRFSCLTQNTVQFPL